MTIQLFPTLSGIIYPTKKIPVWATDVQRSVSGRRTTLAWYSYPIYKFELGFSFLRQTTANKEWQELVAFYNTVNGMANLFRYNDPTDNTVTTGTFGTGDGSTVAFQLLRTITGSGHTWNDPVFYPTVTSIFDNAVLVNPLNYTVGSTGIITFSVAPVAAHTLTWTGTFNWLVRFDEDSSTFEQFAQTFWENKSVKFSSEKI